MEGAQCMSSALCQRAAERGHNLGSVQPVINWILPACVLFFFLQCPLRFVTITFELPVSSSLLNIHSVGDRPVGIHNMCYTFQKGFGNPDISKDMTYLHT